MNKSAAGQHEKRLQIKIQIKESSMKKMYVWRARFGVACISLLALIIAPLATITRTSAASPSDCQAVTLPVSLLPGQPADQTISGTYCTPTTWASGTHTIDVATPGGTYNHLYWDWPQDPATYSYVDKTLQAGRATFNYDRLGTGASSHPLSTTLTVNNEAYVLHQVVQWLRTNKQYQTIDLVGHSYGSIISIQEAGFYHDVNRLVATGLVHLPNIAGGFANALISLSHPAILDPVLASQNLDPGYITTTPGTRKQLFYSSSADPAVIVYDEAHKDVAPLTGLATLATTWYLPPLLNASNGVRVPVLVVLGQEDSLFCGLPSLLTCNNDSQLRSFEAPYYTSAPSLTAITVPKTAHDIALHPSANQSFAQINSWIQTH